MNLLRSNDLADFEHYLQVRPMVVLNRSKKPFYQTATIVAGGVLFITAQLHHIGLEVLAGEGVITALFGFGWFKSPPHPHVTPDQEIFLRADQAAANLSQLMRSRRLKTSMHAGVVALLNESAGSWRKIVDLSQQRFWMRSEVAGHWNASRQDWSRAADLAMAEMLVLAEASLTLRGPRPKAEEVLEDVLDTFGVAKVRPNEGPLPIQFRDMRDLAEKLQILSREVESISIAVESEPHQEPRQTASRRLEEVLGQMRQLKEAEEELHQTT